MRVNKVKYLEDYKLELVFNNKKTKIVDLHDTIKDRKGVFLPLHNIEYFKKVKVDKDKISIYWPNGVDICPDVLYKMGKDI